MLTLYGIAQCDSVKKARAWLEAHELPYQFHDYKKAGVSPALAATLLKALPLDILINRRGTTWRHLSVAEREALQQESTAAALIMAQPSVLKRPIVQSAKGWHAGFDEPYWQQLYL